MLKKMFWLSDGERNKSLMKLGFILLLSFMFTISEISSQDTLTAAAVPQPNGAAGGGGAAPAPVRVTVPPYGGKKDLKSGVTKIIDGENAVPKEFPFMARIMYHYFDNGQEMFGQLCGGSLVSKKYVITAAHCYHEDYQQNGVYYVEIGSVRWQEDPGYQDFNVTNWIVHPQFNRTTLHYDIALLELSAEATLDDSKKIIRLGTKDDTPVGTSCTVLGWGNVNASLVGSDPPKFPNHLKKANVNVVSLEDCAQNVHPSNIFDGLICAENPPKAFCGGDSGGPFVCPDPDKGNELFLIGTVSSNRDPCGEVGNPNVFMRLRYPGHYDFLKQYLDIEEVQETTTPPTDIPNSARTLTWPLLLSPVTTFVIPATAAALLVT